MDNYRDAILYSGLSFALVACFVSGYLIRDHLTHFTQPRVQNKIVGILYMVPIYSIDSFLGLLWPEHAPLINMFRDCYEAYVLYLFLSLMLSYLGAEEDDTTVATYLEVYHFNPLHQHSSQQSLLLPTHEYAGLPQQDLLHGVKALETVSIARGRRFLRGCKFGTLQYCLVRPLCALLALMNSFLNSTSLALTILVLLNVSVAYAFFSLASFYHALSVPLSPFQPIGKFLCLKAVIFFSFWQSVVLFILSSSYCRVLEREESEELNNSLTLIEMSIISLFHLHTFSAQPFYPQTETETKTQFTDHSSDRDRERRERDFSLFDVEVEAQKTKRSSQHLLAHTLDTHFATSTAVRDFNESMPVLSLPTGFTTVPGKVIRSDPAHRLAVREREQTERERQAWEERQKQRRRERDRERETETQRDERETAVLLSQSDQL